MSLFITMCVKALSRVWLEEHNEKLPGLAARRSARREAHRRAAGLPSGPATLPRLPRHVQRRTRATRREAGCGAHDWRGETRTWRAGASCIGGPAIRAAAAAVLRSSCVRSAAHARTKSGCPIGVPSTTRPPSAGGLSPPHRISQLSDAWRRGPAFERENPGPAEGGGNAAIALDGPRGAV